MSEQDTKNEQCPSERKTGIHVWIALGKCFCILVLVLAVLIPCVFLSALFVPRDTPVGVYRARQYAFLHDGANAMFVVTPDYTCFFILYDDVGGPANAGDAINTKGTWKQEPDGSITFTFEFDDGSSPLIIIGKSYWGGLKMKPGEPPDPWYDEFFLPRMLSGFL